MTVGQAIKELKALGKEAENVELKFDNGWDFESIKKIAPKYTPDLRFDKPTFYVIQ